MLICPKCEVSWLKYGNQWYRENGKCDYRCGNCGSKRKPVEDNDYIILEEDSERSTDEIIDSCFRRQEVICNALPELKKNKGIKRFIFIGDIHAGHKSGLTPPEYYVNPYNEKRYSIQKESWEWYANTLSEIGPVDGCVGNGDLIDGKGKRSGGTEQITSDLFKQVKIAKRCLDEVQTDNYFFTYGTPYHGSNDGDDFELSLAEEFNAPIKDHMWLDINGCVFDIKHKIGGSSILASRVNALIKEYQWNNEWYKINGAPQADVFVRSHVHYCDAVTDFSNFYGMTLPALQVADTKYGGRQCSGTVDFGFVLFEIPEDYSTITDVKVTVYKKQLESTRSRSIKL